MTTEFQTHGITNQKAGGHRGVVLWFIIKWKSLSQVWLDSPWGYKESDMTEWLSLSLLQEIFPTQGLNSGLPYCKWILYQLSHKGSPRILEWVAYPFSSGSSQPRNQTRVSCLADGFFTNWAIREAPICYKEYIFGLHSYFWLTAHQTLRAQIVKNLPAMRKTQVRSRGQEDLLEKWMATHSSILAWRVNGQRSLAGYSPCGCRVGHDGATYTHCKSNKCLLLC